MKKINMPDEATMLERLNAVATSETFNQSLYPPLIDRLKGMKNIHGARVARDLVAVLQELESKAESVEERVYLGHMYNHGTRIISALIGRSREHADHLKEAREFFKVHLRAFEERNLSKSE